MDNKNKVFIGFEYEFFYNISTEDILIKLEKDIKKEFIFFNKSHSDFKPDKNKWKLEKDFSGGKEMLELVSGPIEYEDAIFYLKKIFSFIDRNGYTTEKCAFQVNISFNDINKMNNINKLKMILDIDEKKIYDLFPNREDSLYAKSVKYIIPVSKFYIENIKNVNANNYIMPNSKYYGVNFTKLEKNYLEFRYLGGKDYQKRLDDIIILIDYFILLMNKSIGPDFNDNHKSKLLTIINKNKDLLNSYTSYNDFILSFPKIKLYVNLIESKTYIVSYYNQIKDKLFDLLSKTNMKEGIINYNSDSSFFEIKDAKINRVFELFNTDLISCEISGNLTTCNLFNCKIKDSILDGCKIYQLSEINDTKLVNCYVSDNSTIENSYISGRYSIILGIVNNSVFRGGKITNFNKERSKDTNFIEHKIIK